MTQLPPIPRVGVPADVEYRRAGDAEVQEALSLLLTGRVSAYEPAVDHLLQQLGVGSVAGRVWLARQGRQILASAMVQPSAGRTAMAFAGLLPGSLALEAAAELLRVACRAQDPQQVHLIQALLEPQQRVHAGVFQNAGFHPLAELVYLSGRVDRAPARFFVPEDGMEVVHYQAQHRSLFAAAILASYERTLDCPELCGLRDLDDVLDGHMSVGHFRPQLWHVLRHEGRPAGVMLLNFLPQHQALELVYLGLAPAWRGRGLGRRLLAHAAFLAPRQGASTILCAVDDGNAPAVALYRAAGFAPTARRRALILPCRRVEAGPPNR